MLAMASRSFAAVIFALRPPKRTRAGGDEAGSNALGDELALELGERGEDAEDELAGAVVVSIAAPW